MFEGRVLKIVMHCLTMGMHSEKYVKQFHHCAHSMECTTDIDLDGVAYCMPKIRGTAYCS